MKLTIRDRIVIKTLFPQKDNVATKLICRDIADKIKITPAEQARIEMKPEGEYLTWNAKKAKEIEVSFGQAEMMALKGFVEIKDRAKEIDDSMLDTCLKIRNAK